MPRKDDNGNPWVDVDYENKCKCDNQQPKLVNYSMMWHDGDVICRNCGGYIRMYDAG